eukprot:COSAG01_NODE_36758_length_512_cov_42.009685_1_plen_79_part_00
MRGPGGSAERQDFDAALYNTLLRSEDPRALADTWESHSNAVSARPPSPLPSKRLLIESRWVSKPLAFAGELRPRRPNN